MTPANGAMTCERVLGLIDAYIDNELLVETNVDVLQHIQSCPRCAGELNFRSALKKRVRSAGQTADATPEFQLRIHDALREAAKPPRSRAWPRFMMAVAAAAAGIMGVSIAYQLGHLRLTTASRERFTQSLMQRVGYGMGVGLGDHVHCAYFRKYPKDIPNPEQMAADLGPDYKDLLPVIRKVIPIGYTIVMAHKCDYHGRRFVHVVLRSDSGLASLVIARRGDGESFARDQLIPAFAKAELPMYRASVSRFDLTAFETRGHLVYFISDLGEQKNIQIMTALSRPVVQFLNKLES
jgi:Putative zinc-finger